jgi:hypothetical protein
MARTCCILWNRDEPGGSRQLHFYLQPLKQPVRRTRHIPAQLPSVARRDGPGDSCPAPTVARPSYAENIGCRWRRKRNGAVACLIDVKSFENDWRKASHHCDSSNVRAGRSAITCGCQRQTRICKDTRAEPSSRPAWFPLQPLAVVLRMCSNLTLLRKHLSCRYVQSLRLRVQDLHRDTSRQTGIQLRALAGP